MRYGKGERERERERERGDRERKREDRGKTNQGRETMRVGTRKRRRAGMQAGRQRVSE